MERVFIGLLRLRLRIRGARTLKDRRRPVKSLTDRIAHRHGVVVHEIAAFMQPARVTLALTTCGGEPRQIESALQAVERTVVSMPDLEVLDATHDVFRWQEQGSFLNDEWDTADK